MDLNSPDTRQDVLLERLLRGDQLVASAVAEEFGISLDTVRRDILALEASGQARRVRGGAVPVRPPSAPMAQRLRDGPGPSDALIDAALEEVSDAPTVIVDGGATMLALAGRLPVQPGRLVVTPSPWVAVACVERGIEVMLLGGMVRARGGVACDGQTLGEIGQVAADVAVLGACGIDAGFGLSTDDLAEARLKQAMCAAAARTVVVTDGTKLGHRARHRTLALGDLDRVVTDGDAAQVARLAQAGARVRAV